MNEARFEGILRSLGRARSRREFLAVLGGVALAALSGAAGEISVGAESTAVGDATESYPSLAAAWLAWATSQSFVPVMETGHVDCATGQVGETWFLAGSELDAGPIARRCAVPAGTRLFFPVVSAFCAEPRGASLSPEPALTACAAAFIDLFPHHALAATVNGNPVPIVRAQSPLLTVQLDPDNPFAAPAGEYLETADGYWVLLDPLPPGNQVIHFTAAPDVDVTYEVTAG
jgi:hypothetical protein